MARMAIKALGTSAVHFEGRKSALRFEERAEFVLSGILVTFRSSSALGSEEAIMEALIVRLDTATFSLSLDGVLLDAFR